MPYEGLWYNFHPLLPNAHIVLTIDPMHLDVVAG